MKYERIKILDAGFTLFLSGQIFLQAQWGPSWEAIKIIVSPDHTDWVYKQGENVSFTISVWHYGSPVDGATIQYEIGPEKMESTIKKEGKLKGDQ